MVHGGLASLIAAPPLPALIALLLVLGMERFGWGIAQLLQLDRLGAAGRVVLSAATLVVPLTPLAMSGATPPWILRALGGVLAVAGCVGVLRLPLALLRGTPTRPVLRFERVLTWAVLGTYALLALAPPTDPDSLDYHLGGALQLVSTGGLPSSPDWFHGRLSGGGELLAAIGLGLRTELFGQVMQFFGLLALVELFDARATDSSSSPLRAPLRLALITTPLVPGLVSSSKALLLPLAMTTLALTLAIDDRRPRTGLAIGLLVVAAGMSKPTFWIGAAAVLATTLVEARRCSESRGRARSAMTVFAIAVVGFAVARARLWGFGGASDLLALFPGGHPGTDAFERYLRSYRESTLPFPVSLLVPDGPGSVSTVLGVAPLALVHLRRSVPARSRAFLWAGAAVGTIHAIAGQATSRFFLEPVWFASLALIDLPGAPPRIPWFRAFAGAQAIAVLCFAGWFAVQSAPTLLDLGSRTSFVDRFAPEAAAWRWAGEVLPDDAVILSGLRSIALSPRPALSTDWSRFLAVEAPAATQYLERWGAAHPTHVLLPDVPPSQSLFMACQRGGAIGPHKYVIRGRSPFAEEREGVVWLVPIDASRFPGCVREAPAP